MKTVLMKHAKVLVYLIVSGLLGWVTTYYLVDRPELSLVVVPAINYVLYVIVQELNKEGVIEAVKTKK